MPVMQAFLQTIAGGSKSCSFFLWSWRALLHSSSVLRDWMFSDGDLTMQAKIMHGKPTMRKYLIMACVRFCAVWDGGNTCRLSCVMFERNNFFIYLGYSDSLIIHFLISFVQD